MGIDLSILADELEAYFAPVRVYGEREELLRAALWAGEETRPEKGCIYCVPPQMMIHHQALPRDAAFLLLQEPPAGCMFAHYVVISGCTNVLEAVWRVQEVFIKILGWQTSILRLALSDGDMEDIVHQMLCCSMPILGDTLVLHSILHDKLYQCRDIEECYWQDVQHAYVAPRSLQRASPVSSLSRLNLSKGTTLFQYEENGPQFLVYNIFCDDIRMGTLTMGNLPTPLKPSCRAYLKDLGDCLKTVYARVREVPEEPLCALLRQMICGGAVEETLLHDACAQKGWQAKGHTYRICVIRPGLSTQRQTFFTNQYFYRNLIANIYHKSIVMAVEGSIVLIRDFTVSADDQEGVDSMERLMRMMEHTGTCMGVSVPFSNLKNVRIFYEQAFSAARGTGKDTMDINNYVDYLLFDIISCFAQSHSLKYYIHPDVKAVIDYDRRNNTELLESLYYYLLNDRSHKACAEKLHIHRNSFVYRIQKVQDMISCDLSHENSRISLLISICMFWYFNPDRDKIGISQWNTNLEQ